MRYLVTYDLNRLGQNYEQLWDALGRLGATRAMRSAWWLHSDLTDDQLREHLFGFMDANDFLLVVRFDTWSGRVMSGAEIT